MKRPLWHVLLIAVLALSASALSSRVAAAGASLTLYSDANFGGKSVTISNDVTDLHSVGFNDITSSIQWKAGTPPEKASVYTDAFFAGNCYELRPFDTTIQNIGTLGGSTVGNDSISSVRIGTGCPTATVTLYNNSDYSGASKVLSVSTPNLVQQNFNDVTASAINGSGGPVRLWSEAHYVGLCTNLDNQLSNLAPTLVGNHSVSSVEFGTSCGVEVVLYEHPNFNSGLTNCSGLGCLVSDTPSGEHFALSSGENLTYLNGCVRASCDTNLADYQICHFSGGSPLAICDDFNDKASSILLPYGGVAAVYTDAAFKGTCQTITDSIQDLSKSTSIVGDGTISSVAVGHGCVPGFYLASNSDGSGSVLETSSDVVDTGGYHAVFDYIDPVSGVGSNARTYSGPFFSGVCGALQNPQNGPREYPLDGIGSLSVGTCYKPGLILYSAPDYAGTGVDATAATNNVSTLNIAPRSLVNSTSQTLSVYGEANQQGACLNVAATSGVADLSQTYVGNLAVASIGFGSCPPQPVLTMTPVCPPPYSSTIICIALPFRIPLAGDVPVLEGENNKMATAVTNYSNGTISLYRDFNYLGVCQNIPPGASVELAGSVVGAYSVSSARISGPCPPDLELFDSTAYGGANLLISTDTGDLKASKFGRLTSSLANNSPQAAAVYSQPNYQGRCETVEPGQALRSLEQSEVGNNDILSVRFGTACTSDVLLYPAAHFVGVPGLVAKDKANLAGTPFDQVAVSMANNTNQTISVYSGPNYTGRCQNVPPQTAIGDLAGSVVHSHAIQSVKISAACPAALVLYPQSGYNGQPVGILETVPDLSLVQFAARAASLANNTQAPWAVYEGPGFFGRCQTILPGQVIASLGAAHSIGAHLIRSVKFDAAC